MWRSHHQHGHASWHLFALFYSYYICRNPFSCFIKGFYLQSECFLPLTSLVLSGITTFNAFLLHAYFFLQCSSRRELYSPFYCCSNCYFQMIIKKSCVPVYSYRFPTPPTRCPFQFRSQYLHPKKFHFIWIWCITDFELNMY